MTGPLTPGGIGVAGAEAGAAAGKAAKAAGSAVGSGLSSASSILDPLQSVRAWVSDRHNLVRVAWVGAGIVLWALGMHALVQRATGLSASAVQDAVVGKVGKVTSLVGVGKGKGTVK